MRPTLESATVDDSLFRSGNKLGHLFQTLAGTFTMTAGMPHIIALDPGGANRTVLLPPEVKGRYYRIINLADVASEVLTVKEDSNTTTIGTVYPGQVAEFVCSGNAAGGAATPTWFVGGGGTNSGVFIQGSDATDRVAILGHYKNPAVISVSVPSITDPDIARVQVNVAAAFSIQPTIGDAVIAIPRAALPTNCRLQGAWVYQTDGIEVVFGSEGGNVTGAATNFDFLIFDLT